MTRPFTGLVLALSIFALPAAAQEISAQRLSDITRELASESYAGRAPGGPGEQKTVDFIVAQFKALGLTPAGDKGGWTQEVPLWRYQTQPGGTYTLDAGGQSKPLHEQTDLRIETQRPVERVVIRAAPMVFVGYGVTAPERGWDDFKGVDLKGKIALVLINDPDFEAMPGDAVAGKFGGKAATFYARWVYKYEEAVRRGALGVLIVHETAGAAYGWNTVVASNGESYDVVRPDPAKDKLLLQGWIQRDLAVQLFKDAGLDFEAEKARAKTAGFRPVELKGATFSADYQNTFTRMNSQNVLAAIPGAKRPGETILYAAHWDAYGVDPADPTGKVIRPGAVDDAVGVAGVIETARAFKAGPPPERTILFAAWTGEERGLLGSEYYAQRHEADLAKMVANYTFDVLQTAGPARDVVLVGSGQNELEPHLAQVAAKHRRTITPDPKPERALFYRADHFSVAKRGVPTILLMGMSGGADLISGGRAAGETWVEDYTARCYHQTCDVWAADQNYQGAADDVILAFEAGRDLANSTRWPDWNPTSEFKAVRAKTAAARK
ncbi:MAG: M20/M25/M40 family metallo-hydrolase [Phenylobacterium sp.]|uniref:M20/M25/M40 family metallo-hydrolase n=1 Tax=Phenylobacterium sp. TaxID=1871053 RepID=UPI001202B5AF|nr:M20/M25/M40 family metallo-hydrolase [Phenylobacterium sp.]TAJ74790.1 MAG: M20/M25/M40 family metallo-hydrolase [Phenylobacterium sp.]